MKLNRLRGRKTSQRVMKDGKVWKGNTMVIRWLPGHPKRPDSNLSKPGIYVGTFASQKLNKSAVKRNRMRRRIREALRKHVRELEEVPTIQLLLSPRSRSLSCDFADIQEDVRSFLSHVS